MQWVAITSHEVLTVIQALTIIQVIHGRQEKNMIL